MRFLRASCLLPLIALLVGALIIIPLYSSASTFSAATKLTHSLSSYIPSYSFKSSASQRASVGAFDLGSVKKNRRYAITSSVQTASFASLALNLAYSIQKYNDLDALDAELILLVRTEGEDGVSAENITRLEKVGWKVQVAEELEFEQVDTGAIRSWHRHNLNKLHIWSWTQYEKILFVDADVLCKGSFAELFQVPGDIAAAPDVWWNILTDYKFNSGVIVIRPNLEEFRSLFKAVSDPKMHAPNDADQAFLNNYYQFRYFGLPYKYNLNIVMFHWHPESWDILWDEAVFIHFTTRKPMPYDHCERTCDQWEVLSYYGMIYQEMLNFYGFTDLPVLA